MYGDLFLGEHRVVELVAHLGLAQSTVSQHLACLRDCGLVTSRAEGRSSHYSLPDPTRVRALLTEAGRRLAATGGAAADHDERHSPARACRDGSGRGGVGPVRRPGVTTIHDLHLWTLTSGMHVATAHLVATGDTDAMLTAAATTLRQEFGVEHATLQVESDARACQELSW